MELNEIHPATSGFSEENMKNFTSFPHLCLLYSSYDVMEDISMRWTWWLTQGSWEIGLVSKAHRSAQSIIFFFLKALKYSSDLVMGNSKLHLNPFRRSAISWYITGAKCFNSVSSIIRKKTIVCVYIIYKMCICRDTHAHFASLYFPKTGVSP